MSSQQHVLLRDSRPRETTKQKHPFWLGGAAASTATLFTHPLDLVKACLQHSVPGLSSSSPSVASTLRRICNHEGVLGVYAGLSAALLRQLTYSTTRLGVYEELKARCSEGKPAFTASLQYILLAAFAGVLGGIAGNPADVVNVRMQTDAALPVARRRNYASAVHGLFSIVRDEGYPGLFRGLGSNVARSALMTASQIGSYDVFKAFCLSDLHMRDGTGTHLVASALAGLTATTVCSPVDVIKTRVMTSSHRESVGNILSRAFREEGIAWAFKGWLPSFMRLGPQTILTMVFLEQFRAISAACAAELPE